MFLYRTPFVVQAALDILPLNPKLAADITVAPANFTLPVVQSTSLPIVHPPIANDVPVATPNAGVINEGFVCITATVPVPVNVYSPNTPALSYNMRVVVPLVIAVVPTTKLELPPPLLPHENRSVD